MRGIYRFLLHTALWATFWILYAPIAFGIGVARFWASRSLLANAVECETCGSEISLVGPRACGTCGFRSYGFLLGCCELCGDTPPYLNCGRCGASVISPLV